MVHAKQFFQSTRIFIGTGYLIQVSEDYIRRYKMEMQAEIPMCVVSFDSKYKNHFYRKQTS